MSGTDIFLSYARQDRSTARMFAECLLGEGFTVWWDASLHSGETFDEVIEQRLRDAKAVIVLWSPRSVASRWVRAEATLADRRNKLVPAIIEACDRPIIFELTHAAELADWTGDVTDARWRAFVDDLRRQVAVAVDQEPAAAARPPLRQKPVDEAVRRPQSPTRQPLRPGNDEVIFPSAASRAAPLSPAALAETMTEDLTSLAEIHCLAVEGDELDQDLIIVDAAGAKVGRAAPADIVLSHKSVSREHCIIGLANDELLVTDLNSTNGTYIDDLRISRTTILPVGSLLRLGQISLRHTTQNPAQAERLGRLDRENGKGGPRTERVAASS